MLFALATVAHPSGAIACIEVAGNLYPMSACAAALGIADFPTEVIGLFADWDRNFPLLERISNETGRLTALALKGGQTRLAPLRYPAKVLCAGANYHDHLQEMGVPDALDKSKQRLFFFFKPSRQAIVGEGPVVYIPVGCERFDWEVELALVIGRTARHVTLENALSHVAAYTTSIDFSARDFNRAPDTFYKLDWVAGKAHDTCCPIGPRLVPARFIADPQDMSIKLSVNGIVKQDARTSGMVFNIAEQLVTLSRIMTLEPGDLILTGTPAGVGAPKNTFLKAGDVVEADIEQIGKLTVTVQPSMTMN